MNGIGDDTEPTTTTTIGGIAYAICQVRTMDKTMERERARLGEQLHRRHRRPPSNNNRRRSSFSNNLDRCTFLFWLGVCIVDGWLQFHNK